MRASRYKKARVGLRLFGLLAMYAVCVGPAVAGAESVNFPAYPAAKVYQGKAKIPDFRGKNQGFAAFRTRIVEGMKSASQFAGEYSVIQFGCGTGCSKVVIANRRTGELQNFPRGGEMNQGLTLQFEVGSKLMLARWYTDSFWEDCILEAFVFDAGRWTPNFSVPSKDKAACESDSLSDGIRLAVNR